MIKQKLESSVEKRDTLIKALRWDYPTHSHIQEPDAEAVLQEVNGWDNATGKFLGAYTQLKDDGSTSCGCWIYCGVFKDGVNQAARRKPHWEQSYIAPEWAWAWPAKPADEFEEETGEPPGFIHMNDSEGALASNRDRHTLIGDGQIGVEPFRNLFMDRRSRGIPLILETPQLNMEIADDDAPPTRTTCR